MIQQAVIQAGFLLLGMSIAGAFHVLWLKSPYSNRFNQPVDFGITFRSRRLFGENKRLCGFMVLPPAAAATFLLLYAASDALHPTLAHNLWNLSTPQQAGFGLICGLAFMLAELPNSFIKRQLDIAPGETPTLPRLRVLILLIDRFDSVLGVLLVATLLVPLSALTWIIVLIGGPFIHALFSIAMHAIGIKRRAL